VLKFSEFPISAEYSQAESSNSKVATATLTQVKEEVESADQKVKEKNALMERVVETIEELNEDKK